MIQAAQRREWKGMAAIWKHSGHDAKALGCLCDSLSPWGTDIGPGRLSNFAEVSEKEARDVGNVGS